MLANKVNKPFEMISKGNIITTMNEIEVQRFNNLVHIINKYEQYHGNMISQKYLKALYLMLTLGYVCYSIQEIPFLDVKTVVLPSLQICNDTLNNEGYYWNNNLMTWVYIGKGF